MDVADVLIEGAGFALLATILTGVYAALQAKRRLMLGIAGGLLVALLLLPFVAYVVAWLTHHLATDADLTPPTYIVATALACAAIGLAGTVIGGIAELRHPIADMPVHERPTFPDEDGQDDPSQWLPWKIPPR